MSNDLATKYPNLPFRRNWEINESISLLLGQCEAYTKAISFTPILPEKRKELLQVSFEKGAQATTAIEGNTLTEEEVAIIHGGESLEAPSQIYQEIEVRNVLAAFSELFTEVVRKNECKLITPDLIKRFHVLIGKDLGEHLAADPGRFREREVTVGKYRCPDHLDVPDLIEAFCAWLRTEFHFEGGDQDYADFVIQAIISHVYLELIHPFSDGNGRTGRLIEFYILLRGGIPNIASHLLSNHYNKTRNEYYRQIDNVTKERSLTKFIEYALVGFRDGLVKTLEEVQLGQFDIAWKKAIYDTLSNASTNKQVTQRRRDFMLSLPLNKRFKVSEVSSLNAKAAKLYLSKSYKSIERDLNDLKELELLIKDGVYYSANVSLLGKLMAPKKKGNNDINSAGEDVLIRRKNRVAARSKQ